MVSSGGKRENDNSRASIARVTDEKYYSIEEFLRVCKKKPVQHVFEMQFNGNKREEKGDVLSREK